MTKEKKPEPKKKPEVELAGQDGNIFSIIGRCRRALRKVGQHEEATEMVNRAKKAGSYAEALGIVQEYVDAC